MEITVTRTRFQGVRQMLGPVSTTGDLSEWGEEIEQQVNDMNFFELPPQIESGGGLDGFFYTTTIIEGNRYNHVQSDDLSDEPYRSELRKLIALLRRTGDDFGDQPPGEPIDWDEVSVIPLFVDGFLVIVSGFAPDPMIVTFEPDAASSDVDYVPVRMTGRRALVGGDAGSPWRTHTPLDRLPHGRKGTVLVGAGQLHHIPPLQIAFPPPHGDSR